MLRTKQEIFDFVCSKLLEQGRPALNEQGCAYRGDDGTKCAAGWLIPDHKYTVHLEGLQSNDTCVSEVLIITQDPDLDEFVLELQQAHDGTRTEGYPRITAPFEDQEGTWLQNFRTRAAAVAMLHNLNTEVLRVRKP